MTATDRDRLAAALMQSGYGSPGWTTARGMAEALMPVIDRIANERTAAELRASAAAAKRGASTVPDLTGRLASLAIATGLELRADALDPR